MTAGASKRKWHSRSRMGCLTCRRRRIKCDEKRPICAHCEKGARECNYPPHMEPMQETIEDSISLSTNSELTKVSSSAIGSLPTEPEESFDSTQIDPKMVIESLASPSYSVEPLCMPAVLIMSGPTPTTYSQALQLQHAPLSIKESMLGIPQSISSQGTRSKPVQFFLQYHRETITEAHYLRWYDYSKLSTVIIFTLAETSVALQYAMVAFSALIYSIKVNQISREIAFLYYSVALQHLRLLLDKPMMDMTDCFAAVATALQLSTFDRFFGDTKKCFHHLKGAARILQQVTNPVQVCSSVVGRSLLEWFMQFENFCCLMASYKTLLSRAWREEDVHTRQKLAVVEYPHLSDSERKARVLDDVWSQAWLMVPELADVAHSMPKLKALAVGARAVCAIELRKKLIEIEETLDRFLCLPHVLEVLEPAIYSSPHPSKHANCCPPPPFVPYALQFPPAGILRIVIFSLRCYIQSFLWTPIHEACGPEAKPLKLDETYAIEVCRTFAGIEDALGDSPDSCLPLFTVLVLSISTCPQELRLWFWHKLAHFERLGLATFKNPIKDYYAKLWNITDIRPEMKGVSESISTRDETEDVAEV